MRFATNGGCSSCEYEQEELVRLKREIYQRRKDISHPILDELKAVTRALKKGDGSPEA